MNTITRLGLFTAAGAALALSSCSTGGRSPSGFLSNYAQLNAGYGTEDAVSSFVKPGVDFKKYDSVIISPVTTAIGAPGVSTAVKEQLAAYLGESLQRQISPGLKFVSDPSPSTLRVRTGLTDVIEGQKAGRPDTTVHANPVVTLTGSLGSAEVAALVSSISFEGEVVDSMTGERLVALVDHRIGKKREATPTTSWASVRSAINIGVERLRTRFTAVSGR
jgi:hypothetical protein